MLVRDICNNLIELTCDIIGYMQDNDSNGSYYLILEEAETVDKLVEEIQGIKETLESYHGEFLSQEDINYIVKCSQLIKKLEGLKC